MNVCVSSSSGEIEGQLYDRKMVDKSIQNMQNDMLKLNQLLTREGKIRQDLHQDNALIENDFVLSLRVCLTSVVLNLFAPTPPDFSCQRCSPSVKLQILKNFERQYIFFFKLLGSFCKYSRCIKLPLQFIYSLISIFIFLYLILAGGWERISWDASQAWWTWWGEGETS